MIITTVKRRRKLTNEASTLGVSTTKAHFFKQKAFLALSELFVYPLPTHKPKDNKMQLDLNVYHYAVILSVFVKEKWFWIIVIN